MREPHAVSVAVDEKLGSRGGLKLVGSEVLLFRGRGDDSLDEVRRNVDENDDCPSHFVRMADRTLHRHGSAHAVADKVRSRDLR